MYGTSVPWVNMGQSQPGSASKFPPFFVGKIVGGVGGQGIYKN